MSTFQVQYYDGQSSKPYPATLQVLSSHWYITYSNANKEQEEVFWLLGKIAANEISSTRNVFKYGDFPQQSISCTDPTFLATLEDYYPTKSFVAKKYRLVTKTGLKGLIAVTTFVIAFLVVSYLFLLPALATVLAENLPISLEQKLGETTYSSTLLDYKKHDELSVLVNDFAQEIDFQTDYDIQITVVESYIMNAFALPGGHVVIFEELLDNMETPEELAALLAHEVAHVEHRHSLKAMCRSLANYLLISFLLSDANAISAVLVENADMLVQLKFSRDLETEADVKALETLAYNKIDQVGMSQLFETLQKESLQDLEEKTNFLSTHPILQDRIDRAKGAAEQQETPELKPSLADTWQLIKNATE